LLLLAIGEVGPHASVPRDCPRRAARPSPATIDIVQVRHDLIHILDFKPGAKSVKPIDQFTT
jgi:hypothetical protein